MNKKTLTVLLASIAAVVVVLASVFIIVKIKRNDASKYRDSSDTIQIPGFVEIVIPDNTKKVAVLLPNPAGNPCDFIFELVLNSTGEVIYRSEKVAPGTGIEEIELTEGLTAGTYDATVRILTYSVSDGAEMNGAEVATVLKVK